MIKKKGFTLVELLSVIAILTILVLIALPNIVGFFTSSKMNSFKNELQSAYSASEEKWVKDHITHRGEIVYARTASNNCELSLDLSGRQTFNYYIKMNNKGKIIEYYAEDGIYQYMYTGDGLEKEDITEVVEMSKININDRINFTCDGKVEQSEPTVTLTVNPNGGTWNGSSSSQTFNQKAGTTKTISNPTSKSIQISYNDNGQGATFDSTPQTDQAPFNKWNIGGVGTLNGTTYTFGSSNGTLTAEYSPTSITLKTITKNGYTCKWAENSPAGSQVSSGDNISTSTSMTFYAVCTPGGGSQEYTLIVDANGGTWNGAPIYAFHSTMVGVTQSLTPDPTKTITITYDENGQGATFSNTTQSVQATFNKWTLSGAGTLSGTTYTFEAGDGTVTASYNESEYVLQSITKNGYICKWAEGSASGTQYTGGTSRTITENKTYYAVCTANSYILTVKPNGGTWDGKTTSQDFTQNYGTTKTIANPTVGSTYSISYNMNGTGITKPTSPVSVQRPFTSWTKDGEGTLSGATYTFGAGAGTLTANYNTTSSSFTLPSISKSGYTCKWAEGSASGTQYTGGASRTITGNKTYYAVCTANSYILTVKPNGGTWGGKTTNQTFTQACGSTKTIANPTAGPTYSISYNMNGTGITAPTSPVSVQRPFTSWTKDGEGTLSGATYTFGAGAGTLTANYNTTSSSFTLPSISKSGYTCKWAEGSASGTQYTGGASRTITGNKTYYAVCTANSYKLTVNPNGGTWGGKTTNQDFTQAYGTTKTIANPTVGPTYSITYDMNGTGITKPTSPVSVQRPFTSWTKDGEGTLSGATYTFGAGAGTLTANYNTTSSSFTLPSISKSGYTCKWAEGSASGTQYTGGASRTITGNKTYYAVCTANSYILTVKPNGGTWGGKTTNQDFTQNYGTTKTIANPTAGPTYSITYDMNGTGVTKPTSPVSVQRPFDSWIAGGSGSISGTTYTFGAGAGTLTAIYKTASNKFTLPALSKDNFTCNWLEDSTSGTQYAPGAQLSISSNKTYYAKCVENCKWLCPTGYSGDGSGGCVQTKDATKTPYCPTGSKDMDASGLNFGTYSYYDCYNTSSFTGGTCVGKPYTAYGDNNKYCFSYYSYSYSCDSGWTLSGTSCYRTASKECRVSECTWKCPTGYTANSSGMCEKTTTANSQGICPSGSKDMVASGLNFGNYSYYDCYQHWSFPGSTYAGTPYTGYGDNNKYYFSYYESYSYTCPYGGVLNGQTCKFTVEKDCN